MVPCIVPAERNMVKNVRSRCASLPPHPGEQFDQPSLRPLREMCFPPERYDPLGNFSLCGIGMNRSSNCLGPCSRVHGDGKFADHVAGMGGHDRRAENFIRPFLDVNPCKPVFFSV